MEFEPDEKEQQDDADFGNGQLRFRAADETQPLRADQRAGDEIAQHRAQAEAAEQQDEGHGDAEQDHAFGQENVGGRHGGFGDRHQASAIRAASAIASKPSRIEGWRAG